jgi:hypothetical protein
MVNVSFKKLFNDYGIFSFVIIALVVFGLYVVVKYLSSKGNFGQESLNSNINNVYKNSQPNVEQEIQPSDESLGKINEYASMDGSNESLMIPSSCSGNTPDPSELLPKDVNNEWARLNPTGKGELSQVNLLKAGYHIGIDTIGQSLRNANLQIRSEPPNPQLNVGPWNQSTITPDFMRVPLELGVGSQ